MAMPAQPTEWTVEKAHGIGEALVSPADIVVFGPRKFVQPDLFVLPLVDALVSAPGPTLAACCSRSR
jgi:hypothetical protein